MTLIKHPKAEALIFDMDGTLTNSLPIHVKTWQKVCAEFDFHFDAKMIEELTGRPTSVFAQRVLEDNNSDAVSVDTLVKMKQETFWDYIDLIEPHPQVIDFMKSHHGKIPMAVGTGANQRSAELQLEKVGITKYFDVIVTAQDVSKHKPEPDTFLKCAELMNVSPQVCQVLEDGVLGMEAAQSAGMYLIDVRPYTV